LRSHINDRSALQVNRDMSVQFGATSEFPLRDLWGFDTNDAYRIFSVRFRELRECQRG
jgi:hypothetical protein